MDAPPLFSAGQQNPVTKETSDGLKGNASAMLVQVIRLVNELKTQIHNVRESTQIGLQDAEKRIILSQQLEEKSTLDQLKLQVERLLEKSTTEEDDEPAVSSDKLAQNLQALANNIVGNSVDRIETAVMTQMANSQSRFLNVLLDTFKNCMVLMASSFDKTLSAFLMALPPSAFTQGLLNEDW